MGNDIIKKKALISQSFFEFVGVAGLQPPHANLYVSISYKTSFQQVHRSVLNLFELV